MNKTLVYGGILIAIVIAVIGALIPHQPPTKGVSDYFYGDFFSASTGFALGAPIGKSISDTNSQLSEITVGSCSTASTTLFAVQSPFSAATTNPYGVAGTSTARITIFGTVGATTSDMLVGTSTKAYTPALNSGTSSLASLNLLGVQGMATSSNFFFSSGDTKGLPATLSGLELQFAAQNSYEIPVGASEWLLGFATSTYIKGNGGLTNGTTMDNLSSCTYKIQWRR